MEEDAWSCEKCVLSLQAGDFGEDAVTASYLKLLSTEKNKVRICWQLHTMFYIASSAKLSPIMWNQELRVACTSKREADIRGVSPFLSCLIAS